MKKLLFFFLCTLSFLANVSEVLAQQAEKIFSITEKRYPLEYYHQQVTLWKAILDDSPSDTGAWENYYAASRMANLLTDTGDRPYDLDEILADAALAIPQTFTYNYLAYWNYTPQPKFKKYLQKAYQIDPNRPEIYDGLMLVSEQEGNRDSRRQFSKKNFDSGNIDEGVLTWNYNQLLSVEDNAVLITFGDNDTYPSWVLQDVKEVKPNVAILNIHLLKDYRYRVQAFEQYGLPPLKMGTEMAVLNSKDTLMAALDQLVNQEKRPVYFGVATPESVRERYAGNLYLVGMAFKYSKTDFDNLTILEKNVEEKFLLDDLKTQLKKEDRHSVLPRLNANYLPGFLLLYDHYQQQGKYDKAKSLKKIMNRIAYRAKMETQLTNYFIYQPIYDPAIGSVIKIKDLEKNLKEVRPGFYANATEVSNEEYEKFLIDLLKQKQTQTLPICQSEKTDWRELAAERLAFTSAKDADGRLINQRKDEVENSLDFSSIDDQQLFVMGHPDDDRSPIQNIQHEAAKAYCYWITQVYNRSTDKKKQFKKVIFRLPTEAEWKAAARFGYQDNVPYAWGGYYYRNEKGCYLLNTNPFGEPDCCKPSKVKLLGCDGLYFGGITDAYFPNNIGLYNTCGNIAEMIQTEGIAKGGSWAHTPDQCTIDSQNLYNGPDPAVGFRIFMEIVER